MLFIYFYNKCNTCYDMVVKFVMYVITNVMCWNVDRDGFLGLNECGFKSYGEKL